MSSRSAVRRKVYSSGAVFIDDHPAIDWVLYELDYDRREAQFDAETAYQWWCEESGRDAYTVYRAAQDRADAAQDALAQWVHRRNRGHDQPSGPCAW